MADKKNARTLRGGADKHKVQGQEAGPLPRLRASPSLAHACGARACRQPAKFAVVPPWPVRIRVFSSARCGAASLP